MITELRKGVVCSIIVSEERAHYSRWNTLYYKWGALTLH